MNFVRKIAALNLAILLVTSTTGITLNKHFCMGELKDVSFYEETKNCLEKMDMDMEESKCPMNACEDKTEEYKADELSKTSYKIDFKNSQHLLTVLTYLLLDHNLVSRSSLSQVNLFYKSPLINQDIPILIQSFLI